MSGRFVKLFDDELAKLIEERGRKHYRPSNGTEGMMFMDRWCEVCRKFSSDDTVADCQILDRTMFLDIADEGYPAEWIYNEGQPCCTAFEERSKEKP